MLQAVLCQPGGHIVEVEVSTDDAPMATKLPDGWRVVHASFSRATEKWYADPNSAASVPICPEHSIEGE